MSQYSLERLMRPITNKITLMLGRAVIRALQIDHGKVLLDCEMFADDLSTKLEYFSHHGLFSKPPIGSHCMMACPGGRRDHAVIIAVKTAAAIPENAAIAEVALYNSQGSYIAIMPNGDIAINGSKVTVTCDNAEVAATGNLALKAPNIALNAANVTCSGVLTTSALAFAAASNGSIATVRGAVNFNIDGEIIATTIRSKAGKNLDTHTHSYTDNGAARVTGVPR